MEVNLSKKAKKNSILDALCRLNDSLLLAKEDGNTTRIKSLKKIIKRFEELLSEKK